jgi:hypothetical protein
MARGTERTSLDIGPLKVLFVEEAHSHANQPPQARRRVPQYRLQDLRDAFGGPNTPGPASCIAPKPKRFAVRSPSVNVPALLISIMSCLLWIDRAYFAVVELEDCHQQSSTQFGVAFRRGGSATLTS